MKFSLAFILAILVGSVLLGSAQAHAQNAPKLEVQYQMKGHQFHELLTMTFATQVSLAKFVSTVNDATSLKAFDPMITDMKFIGATGSDQAYEIDTSTKKYMIKATVVEACKETVSTVGVLSTWSRKCELQPGMRQTGWAFISGSRNITCTSKPAQALVCVAEFQGVLKDFKRVVFNRTARELAVAGLVETLNMMGTLFECLNQDGNIYTAQALFNQSDAKKLSDATNKALVSYIAPAYSDQLVSIAVSTAQPTSVQVKLSP
jgi:hypothetical protein